MDFEFQENPIDLNMGPGGPAEEFDPFLNRVIEKHGKPAPAPLTTGSPRWSPNPAQDGCDFCVGNEHTTAGREHIRSGDGPVDGIGWQARAFRNAVRMTSGNGADVIVASPDHGRGFGQLTDSERLKLLVLASEVADRQFHRNRAAHGEGAHTAITVNHLRASGGSVLHPHWQVLSYANRWPSEVANDDQILERVPDAGSELTVASNDFASAWIDPNAETFTFRVTATEDLSFTELSEEQLAAVGDVVSNFLARTEAYVGNAPYNLQFVVDEPRLLIHGNVRVLETFRDGESVLRDHGRPKLQNRILQLWDPASLAEQLRNVEPLTGEQCYAQTSQAFDIWSKFPPPRQPEGPDLGTR